ncbi:hypothetical protein TW85_22240 [Marinomonas sp. S3726]|uniref:hypothetical protein n=1 Tax=Marinomonas sp. S3726 TaxID=579484 RepID=UPI0005FA6FF3|nr:hypothetical protein [Marinomonas sp. S3726]KJZ09258.1 hypothetical protein TW85_22240 [Marinomonas sp. S3726]
MISMKDLYEHSDYENTKKEFLASNNAKRWSIFKPVHLKVTKNKCPICECRLDGSLTRPSNNSQSISIEATIDHYRPKKNGLYPFLKYEDKNYIVMCSDCNNLYKGCEFPLFPPAIRGTCSESIKKEQPLIVNPLTDNLSELFNVRFVMSQTGRNLLELTPRNNNGYEYEKALKTIKMFGIGHYDEFLHSNNNAKLLRLEILSSHYQKFKNFIRALKTGDKEMALLEYKNNNLSEFGLINLIKKQQFSDFT